MLAGYEGHLLGELFLVERVSSCFGENGSPLSGPGLQAWREGRRLLGPASSLRSILDLSAAPLLTALGFAAFRDHGRVGTAAYLTANAGPLPLAIVITHWGEPLAPLWPPAVRFAIAQEAPFCLLLNGTHLRLVTAQTGARRFAEFDLDAVADEARTADALWLLVNRSAVERHEGALSLAGLLADSDQHAAAVSASLRTGVLAASEQLLGALMSGTAAADAQEAFGQALTIVYRLLFLLFAEARALLPVWHPVYRDSYALERLCENAQHSTVPGLWDALRAISRLSHAGCRAGDLRVTAFNGRLFAPARTPLAERRNLDDEAARQTLIALSSRPAAHGEGRVRVSYRELGVEQLGAVYETLLDYKPEISAGTTRAKRRRVALTRGASARKSTGSFYTPQSMTRYLVERALGPLVRDVPLERILGLRILDPAMGSGAFLVSACEYLAEAGEAALIRDGQCHPNDIGPHERATLRRQIAERCLFGVDSNPMAVQLARLSLWLTTLAADRPLSFLDHHLRTGDSLLGAWLHCLDHPPHPRARRDADLPLFDGDLLEHSLRDTMTGRFTMLKPSATLADVRAKEQTLARLERGDSPLARWKQIADLWCAAWFAPELAAQPRLFRALSDVVLGRNDAALPATVAGPLLARSSQTAQSHAFFHWELEFPEVFFDLTGRRLPWAGFDGIIGNPPWDMMRAGRGADGDARESVARAVRFSRDAGIYKAQSDGHVNRYQLFLERSLALLSASGRLGMVFPSGLIADQGSASLRRHLFSTCAVEDVVGFDNRRAIFPIHRSIRFVLLTARAGEATATFRCRLGESDPGALAGPGPDAASSRGLSISVDLLRALSGDDLSIPDLRDARDLAIAEHVATRFAPLGSGRGWKVRFGRELNATDDRGCFSSESGAGSLPVIEGKHLEPFAVDTDRATRFISERDAAERLGRRHLQTRLAYRDVASATNRTTLIAALLPRASVSTHTVFCLRERLRPMAQWFLCGLFNSLVVNYLARLRVTTHVTTAIVEGLPVPTEDDAGPLFAPIAALARSLSRRSTTAHFSLLNARVASLYGLTRDEFEHVLATFPLVDETERHEALELFGRL